MIMRASLFVWCFLFFAACAAPRRAAHFYQKNIRQDIQNSPVFAKGFTGFVLRDAVTGRTLCDVNGDQLFTPASNTKILTLATCLAVLGDSVPGLEYIPIYDEPSSGATWPYGLCFRGTGDPTFLHPQFEAWQPAAAFLRSGGSLIYENRPIDARFGPGWAWDDYGEYYSAERSALPMHGNQIYLQKGSDGCRTEWSVTPDFFRSFLQYRPGYDLSDRHIARDEISDTLWLPYYADENFPAGFEKEIPVWQAGQKTLPLLNRLLGVEAMALEDDYNACGDRYQVLHSAPLDTVLRRMMYQSDNFIAEQMLLVCAGAKFGVLRQDTIIQWAKDSLFPLTNNQFPITNNQSPRWVDGSGLSRYNLASPRYLTDVLLLLWRTQPRERLFSLFPTPGAPETTLDWWQPAPAKPWLFAKTGSMSGVQCLNGYLVTKKGEVLVFSFMHNNFIGSGRPRQLEMRRILEAIHAR